MNSRLATTVCDYAIRLVGDRQDWTPLLERIADARFVLLGEASHGTHEFYAARANITRRLIEEKRFNAIAVEADWPDAALINHWVRGGEGDADYALRGFERFPRWMWRNTDVLDFITWLRAYNEALPPDQPRVGFYGLDLYSLQRSRQAVIEYLDRVDPQASRLARERYSCFDHNGDDGASYGRSAFFGLTESCENEVIQQLIALQSKAAEYAPRDGRVARDEFFHAEQNAKLVRNAERYYRTMFSGRVSSWNLRDRHMADTLDSLTFHLSMESPRPKIAVWAHNSHLGDARATETIERGEHNLGQLVRERWGPEAFLVGFTTDHGTVTAANDWDAPAERKRVRPGLPGSIEALFHECGIRRFLIFPQDAALNEPRLERAIGVIYRPQTERASHYFYVRLARQFDAVIHYDETRALRPLEPLAEPVSEEAPETYPSGV